MSVEIEDGGLVIKPAGEIRVYLFDWDDENLAVDVTIASQTVTVSALTPSTSDSALTASTSGTGLGIVSSSRKVAVKLTGGTAGQTYRVTSEVVTNETPAQTKRRHFDLLIEDH